VDAIDSVLAQSAPAFEIIVIDDGSTDSTASDIRNRFGDRVHLLQQPAQGVQVARNRGAAAASGEWIAFLDDDDLWDRDFLRTIQSCIALDGGIHAVFSSFRVTGSEGEVLASKFDAAPAGFWSGLVETQKSDSAVIGVLPAQNTFLFQPFFHSAFVVRKDIFEGMHGYDAALRGVKGEDFEFTFRVITGGPCGFVHRPLVTIRKHETNDSGSSLLLTIGELSVLDRIGAKDSDLMTHECRLALAAAIEQKAHQALAAAFSLQDRAAVRRIGTKLGAKLSVEERAKVAVASLPKPASKLAMKALGKLGSIRSTLGL
jgi:glycosyltransferase involved in cell wall biosynthesis